MKQFDYRLIGITGLAGAGKTTIAEYLKTYHEYQILSFGYQLKLVISVLFHIPMQILLDPEEKNTFIPEYGKTVREILQIFGTECMRNHFGQDFWVKKLIPDLLFANTSIVIDDVRFPEEEKLIRDYGGEIWKIERPGIMQLDHSSESGKINYDQFILNNRWISDATRIASSFLQ
jgi:hypothetical protein